MGVLFLTAMSLSGAARAQSDADAPMAIPVHPDVTTILHLPDEIERARFSARVAGLMRATTIDDMLIIQPSAGTPAGMEVMLEVKTATIRRHFRLRVVEHARDARRDVLVSPADEARDATLPALPTDLIAPPALDEPPASPPPEPPSRSESATTRAAEPAAEPAPASTPRFELSVHGLVALGTTAVHVTEYQSTNVRQSHRAVGVRIAAHPYETWWSFEGSISGEMPVTPTTHSRRDDDRSLEVDGPRLRADMGMRGTFGRTLMPTFYAGIGLQAHYLNIEEPGNPRSNVRTRDLPFEGVLALGMGLACRVGDVSLGIDLHVRQGVPPDYRSVAALLSVGLFLDQGE